MQAAAQQPRRVAIIGAGFAGLAAARELLARAPPGTRLSVVILEATSRVGGRARAGSLACGPVELGATWFHGTTNNPVFDEALAKGIIGGRGARSSSAAASSSGSRDSTANAAGGDAQWQLQLVAPGATAPLTGSEHAAVLEAFEAYSRAVEDVAEDNAAAATRRGHTTLGSVLRARWDARTGQQGPAASDAAACSAEQQEGGADGPGRLRQRFAEGWACRERLQRAYDGFSSSDVSSLAHITEYDDLPGPNVPVPGGYQGLAEALAADATALGAQLRLDTVVSKVAWARPDGRVELQLQPGEHSSAGGGPEQQPLIVDALIITVSLGVLKASAAQLFEPPLPAAKAAAIARLHCGQVEKLFIEWPSDGAATRQAASAAAAAAAERPAPASAAAAAAAAAAPPASRAAAPASRQQEQQPPALAAAVVGPRKPKAQQLHDAPAPGPGGGSTSAAFTTHCLLWPTRPELWGARWLAQQEEQPQQAAEAQRRQLAQLGVQAMDLPASDPIYASGGGGSNGSGGSGQAGGPAAGAAQAELPEWLVGLHSWRYGDGPEWIKPAHNAAGGSGSSCHQAHAAPERSAVVWVTGRAALMSAQLSDAEVLLHLGQLLDAFPAVPRPPSSASGGGGALAGCRLLRSSWTSSPYFRGSYSYPGPQADGRTADALAQPLTATDAAAARAAAAPAGPGRAAPVVCFAGEATSRRHMGTVHGAFASGVREALRLLEAWGLQRPPPAGASDDGGLQGSCEYHAAFWL